MKENTVDSEARSLLGFVKEQKHFQWEYSFEFECWESKREQVTIENASCVGLKRKGMVCAVQVKGKHLGRLMAGLQLPCSVLCLQYCLPVFFCSPSPSVPSMAREGSGSSLLRSSRILYRMVELGLWDSGEGQTANGL